MHPLFTRASRLLTYSAAWLVGGVVLAVPLAALSPRPFPVVLAFTIPLALLYGGVCLASWWVCLSRPLAGRDLLPSAFAQLGAALLSTTVWAIAATAWGLVLMRTRGVPPDRAIAHLREVRHPTAVETPAQVAFVSTYAAHRENR